MLRAVSAIYFESQALELFTTARRDVYKLFRTRWYSTAASGTQTVLSGEPSAAGGGSTNASPPLPGSPPPPASSSPPPPASGSPPPPASGSPPRRAWTVVAAALALTASVGGVYFYQKLSEEEQKSPSEGVSEGEGVWEGEGSGPPVPGSAAELPAHVQFLLVGGGTASFAAMRALRSARPEARVLLVGAERALPYMRPPLSKELWREPGLAAADPDVLTFRQWNGKRRNVAYEPEAFYTPVERLAEGGAAAARGWRVVRLDVARHEASLAAPGRGLAVVRYDRCLLATGVRPRRAPALRAAAAAGRSLALRGVRDAQRLAAALERPDVAHVTVLGGGFLASELSAALADRLRASGKAVTQVFREAAPLAAVLPPYLAADAARRLREAGVTLLPHVEVVESSARAEGAGAVQLRLAAREGRGEGDGESLGEGDGGSSLSTDLVVECVGSEVDTELAHNSGLETHPELGGLLVNAELQARSDVYAAGDVACFYDVVLGRRRVEHHDHAVVSGRLAGDNMAGVAPPRPYTHQSMFWSDLGPQLGYEAIGIIDSRLPTVGVFSADAVSDSAVAAIAAIPAEHEPAAAVAAPASAERRFERGVVFYLRDERVVGVLLWNLFNRMHVARQVLAQGYFEDLFEVAKLFALHEEE